MHHDANVAGLQSKVCQRAIERHQGVFIWHVQFQLERLPSRRTLPWFEASGLAICQYRERRRPRKLATVEDGIEMAGDLINSLSALQFDKD